MTKYISSLLLFTSILSASAYAVEPIQHDAEHYMLFAQHGDRWKKEDKVIAEKIE
jgi:hypothetical protein